MTKNISNKNVYQMARDYKKYVENYGGVPYKFTYGGVEFTTNEMQDIMTYVLLHLDSGVRADAPKWCSKAHGDNIVENIYKEDYLNQAERVHNYIIKNKQVPNNVKTVKSKKTVNIDLFTYAVAKTLVYYQDHKQLPNYTSYDYRSLNTKSPAKTYTQEIFDYFCSKFGKVTTIDGALAKIRNKGYGFYFSDKLTNKQVVDGLAGNGQKPNCVDIHQLFWHIGKALGYEVRAVYVYCTTSKVDHIRMDFKHPKNTNGQWIHRDASAVADGECVECIWCGNGDLLGYNPSWFTNLVNK